MAEYIADDVLKQISPGAELAVFCPHCQQGLNTYNPKTGKTWFKLAIRSGGKEGELLLSPRLDDFSRQASIEFADGQAPDEAACPVCRASLLDPSSPCGECRSPSVKLMISAQSRAIPFYICSKAGCRWHGVPKAEEDRIKPKARRQRMPEQDAMLRIRNFQEVPYGFTRDMAATEAGRCLDCKNPKCVEGCPVGIDIPAFIQLIKEGKFVEAAWKIKEKNALPAICGRVCPQEDQCELSCILRHKETPVSIGYLERFAADMERETKSVTIPKKAPPNGKRIAVVGSGPAGLTLAADMVVKGYSITLYEALHKPGGVLVYGIPEFRLPK
ncbi:MAG: NAD(P)-binding protein, partial [Candidatus Edwardsbacteria bacterium]|nr:NAD(P)-binding protein [Candidatus Edwardsbacteria bacterium]